jgi:hypothetical protein
MSTAVRWWPLVLLLWWRVEAQAPTRVLPLHVDVSVRPAAAVLLAPGQQPLVILVERLDERHVRVVVVPALVPAPTGSATRR